MRSPRASGERVSATAHDYRSINAAPIRQSYCPAQTGMRDEVLKTVSRVAPFRSSADCAHRRPQPTVQWHVGGLMIRTLGVLAAICESSRGGDALATQIGKSAVLCRDAPSTGGTVIQRLSPGTEVEVERCGGGFVYIVVSGQKRCWIAGQLLLEDEGVVTSTTLGATSTLSSDARTDASGSGAWISAIEMPTLSRKPRAASRNPDLRGSKSLVASPRASRSGARGRRPCGSSWASVGSGPCSGGNVRIGPRGGR